MVVIPVMMRLMCERSMEMVKNVKKPALKAGGFEWAVRG